MNRRTLILGASALGVAAFAGGAFVLKQRRDAEAEAAAAATPTEDQALLVRDYSPSFGPADAPVTLVEFFDPSCEACRAYHPVVQEIRRQFPTQVRVVLRYTVFHEGSDEAVRILEAARMQDKFEPVLDALLEQQPGILNQDAADVEALAIRQTPTFFLNGKRLENFSADSLIADVRFAVENS
jgi:protein-disulfide isomerase